MDDKPQHEKRTGPGAKIPASTDADASAPLVWRRDVQVPLRECDYQVPLVVRSYPFHLARAEEEPLSLVDAAEVVLFVPYWRRFKEWQAGRPPAEAYLIMKQMLRQFGHAEEDLKLLRFSEALQLIAEDCYHKESDELRRTMGGSPLDFRRLLLGTVGVWITHPKVLEYWRYQVRIIRDRWNRYWSHEDNDCPYPFGGEDPRRVRLPDDLPAIYTAIAYLHDRFNVIQVMTSDLTHIPRRIGDRYRLWPIPASVCPGADEVRWGRDPQVIDFDMVCRFIEVIRQDLVGGGLLEDERAETNFVSTKTLGWTGNVPSQGGENAGGAARGGSRSEAELVRDGVFISYSHKDKKWSRELQDHLEPYTRKESVTAWLDEAISPGQEWFAQIKVAMAAAKVAVLLVSKDFLASEFIDEHEFKPLLEQARTGDVQIIWIPVGACSYKETELRTYQAPIDPDKPLASMRKQDRDKAWVKICEAIKEAVSR